MSGRAAPRPLPGGPSRSRAGVPGPLPARPPAPPLLLPVLFLLLAALPAAAADPPIPAPAGYVNDRAGVMGEWAGRTEALCRGIEEKTAAEVAVLTVPSTAPLPAQDYAQRVFDAWKVGKKGKDNGVLVLVAVGDRRMWIATGYGVEGVLPDGKVGEIRDTVAAPRFRQGAYGEGIYRTVAAVGAALGAGEVAVPPSEARERERRPVPRAAFLILLLALFVLPYLFTRFLSGRLPRGRGGHRGGWPGGFGGGAFGGGGFGGGGFGGFGGGGSGGGGAGGGW